MPTARALPASRPSRTSRSRSIAARTGIARAPESMSPLPAAAREVLEFWFGAEPGPQRAEWFRKDAAFDAQIRERFGELHEAASKRELESWRGAPDSML